MVLMDMEMKNIMKNSNSLYHYGVKGMKWHRRKYTTNKSKAGTIDYKRNGYNIENGLTEYEYTGTKTSSPFDTNSPMYKRDIESTKKFLIVNGILKLKK